MRMQHAAPYFALTALLLGFGSGADETVEPVRRLRVAIPDDVHELVFLPDGRSVALPAGKFTVYREEKYGPVMLKASAPPDYTLSWDFEYSDCATNAAARDKLEAEDTQREFKAFQRLENSNFDSRWFKTHTKHRWGDYYYTTFCLDKTNTYLKLQVKSPNGEYDSATVAAVAKSFADAFGPASAPVNIDAIGYVRGIPNGPAVTPIAEVYPAPLVPVAQACQAGNQLNCEALRAFLQLQQGCNQYGGDFGGIEVAPLSSAPFCAATARFALKQKDKRVAALYFQRACDAGDGDACKEALKQKKKAGM